MKCLIADYENINKTFKRLSHEILEQVEGSESLALIGIRNGGLTITKRLFESIKGINKNILVDIGFLDPRPYRDDEKRIPIDKATTQIEFSLDNKVVVVIDDVLKTGRTARCVLDGIVKFGKLKKLFLLVFVDRGKREFPITPNFVGKNVPASNNEKVIFEIHEEIHPDDKIYIKENGDGEKGNNEN